MNIYGIAASTRENSLNCHLLNRTVDQIEKRGAAVEVMDFSIAEDLPLYTIAREAAGMPADITSMAAKILAADGVLIASPEYNFSIPGALKNTIDWISRVKPSVFTDKPVLLLSTSGSPVGGWRGLAALRLPLTCLGAATLPWEITIGGTTSPKMIDQALASEAMQTRVDTALNAFLK